MAMPAVFRTLEAGTHAQSGERVGDALLSVEKLENGNVRILSQVGITGGASTVAQAILAPIDNGRALRLLRQESRSMNPDGRAMGVLSIDHEKRLASCRALNSEQPSSRTLELPEGDRVVNVAMHLLFEPLLRGEVETVDFRLFVCRPRPYLTHLRCSPWTSAAESNASHQNTRDTPSLP